MLGGLLLGLIEEFVVGYTASSWRDAVAFGFLILVLLVRPQGLFGRATLEKV
jgi:branched-chain amino acid transport system permease protein